MKIARKAVTMLTAAVLVCVLLATAAFAAERGSLWLAVEESDSTAALVVTDTVVTDGVVKLTYDSTVLTYEGTESAADYVAMYAVNAEDAGVVLISWVAPGTYSLEDGAVCLFRVHFSGVMEGTDVTLTGTAHGVEGEELAFADAPDTDALKEAVEAAKALDGDTYTMESYAALEKALADAEAVLADSTAAQSEVDEAEQTLRSAIQSLKKAGAEDDTPKPTEDSGDNADTGDDSHVWLFVVIGILSAVAIVVLVIKMIPKKGRYAK